MIDHYRPLIRRASTDGDANRGTGDRTFVASDLAPDDGTGGAADGLIASPVEVGTTRRRKYSDRGCHTQTDSPYNFLTYFA